jgi:hypothetical protein
MEEERPSTAAASSSKLICPCCDPAYPLRKEEEKREKRILRN